MAHSETFQETASLNSLLHRNSIRDTPDNVARIGDIVVAPEIERPPVTATDIAEVRVLMSMEDEHAIKKYYDVVAGIDYTQVDAGLLRYTLETGEMLFATGQDTTNSLEPFRAARRVGYREYRGGKPTQLVIDKTISHLVQEGKVDFVKSFLEPTELEESLSNVAIRNAVKAAHIGFHQDTERRLDIFSNRDHILVTTMQPGDLPPLSHRLESLGISDEFADSLQQSWFTYSAAYKKMGSPTGRIKTNNFYRALVSQGVIDRQSCYMLRELQAVEDYIKLFGVAEAEAVHSTFGVVNFASFTPYTLHEQLQNWNNPDFKPELIALRATSDWNGAFAGYEDNIKPIARGRNTFWFQASSAREVAGIMVSTGNRERKSGRNPGECSVVQFVVVGGHGASSGVSLSAGEGISTSDITDLQPDMGHNDYSRHLGNNYEVILYSCSAGADVSDGLNIAQALALQLGTNVHAATEPTMDYITLRGGSVLYNHGELPARVASAKTIEDN